MKIREQKDGFGEKRNEHVVFQLEYKKSGVSVCVFCVS